MATKLEKARHFKKMVDKLYYSDKIDIKPCGLCYALSEDIEKWSYIIISNMTTTYNELNEFGPYGVFTEERRDFLMLLKHISIKDIAKFI